MSLLENNLFKPCEEGKSGVVFISTNNNRACQIIIENGSLIAANMKRLKLKGIDAIQELKKLGIRGASFNSGMKIPYNDEEKIETGEFALSSLGYSGTSLKKVA